MSSFRAEFYDSLRTDYKLDGKRSILYGYLKAEKEKLAGDPAYAPADSGARKDSYVTLYRAFCSYKDGALEEGEYLLRFLAVLKGDGRLRLEPAEHAMLEKWRDEMVRRAGEEIAGGSRTKKAVYEDLTEILQGKQWEQGKLRRVIRPEKLESLTNRLLERILHEDAKRLLYDASRKKEKSLELLDYYFSKRHLSPLSEGSAGGGEFLDAEKMEMVQVLFDLLNANDRFEEVFLPVAIDGSTGAGIYITGKEYFSKVDSVKKQFKKGEYCCFSLLYYSEFIVDNVEGAISYSFGLEPMCGAPSLEEVKKWYKKARDDGSLYDAYRENNEEPPRGVPEPFLKYFRLKHFRNKEDTRVKDPTKEEIEKTKADLKAEYEEYEKSEKVKKMKSAKR